MLRIEPLFGVSTKGFDPGRMSARARFRESDLSRAIRAFEKAGLCVSRARIAPDGGIELVAGEPERGDNANWFDGSPLFRNVA